MEIFIVFNYKYNNNCSTSKLIEITIKVLENYCESRMNREKNSNNLASEQLIPAEKLMS